MPLELKYNVEEPQSRTSINFIETTGSYSTGNLGGYGTPNPFVGDAISSSISITKRGSSTTYTINPYSALPTLDSAAKYAISATQFGFSSGEKITDGLYQVSYSVTYLDTGNNAATATDSFYSAFIGGIECCIRKQREKIPVPDPSCMGCQSEQITKLAHLDQLFQSVCELVECDNLDKAEEVIAYLQHYCDCNCADC
jgi:hypothetical protein